MEPLNNKILSTPKIYLLTGLMLLAIGLLFGITGAIQYLVPDYLKAHFTFEKIRPLHVSSILFWIILSSTGGVVSYLQQYNNQKIKYPFLLKAQYVIFLITILLILIAYCFGYFGGKEYWEFPPFLALPIAIGWVLFIINFISSVATFKNQPVYIWMWLTGLVFFLFTFIESYLWIFPYFKNNIINDMTIQWKSAGSMVGAWNMLIYGSSIFLMEKISDNKKHGYSIVAFALYFTGLFNLLFNWGHHIYTLPTYQYIKHISYAVSMTEIILFSRIIWLWKDSVTTAKKHFHYAAYRFLLAADLWIFLTLMLAILMSIPAINAYTHGTHITVAHAMGSTIGINSFLLLAIAFDILHNTCIPIALNIKWLNRGYWITNISLFVFWISLIMAGILKAKWQMSQTPEPFSIMMLQLRPFFIVFFVAGTIMSIGFYLILYPLIKNQIVCYINQSKLK